MSFGRCVDLNSLLNDLLLEVMSLARETTRVDCRFSPRPAWIRSNQSLKALLYCVLSNAIRATRGQQLRVQLTTATEYDQEAHDIEIGFAHSSSTEHGTPPILCDEDLRHTEKLLAYLGGDVRTSTALNGQTTLHLRLPKAIEEFDYACA